MSRINNPVEWQRINTSDRGKQEELTLDYLEFKEIGSAPSATTDYGKLWTQSTNLLYFQDGAGTSHTLVDLDTAQTISGVKTFSGAGTFTSTLGCTGNFAVNTNKFTVTAASGNTAVAGTLGVAGAATFNSGSGDVDFTIKANVSGNAYVYDAGASTHTFTSASTTSKGFDIIADSITTANAVNISADGLTGVAGGATGAALNIESTSTAGLASNSSYMLKVARSGANANASHTAYGAYSVVTNTGTTNTNIAGYFSASGGSSGNFGVSSFATTSGSAPAYCYRGEAKVAAAGDTGTAYGAILFAEASHCGGNNIVMYLSAKNGANNYVFAVDGGLTTGTFTNCVNTNDPDGYITCYDVAGCQAIYIPFSTTQPA